MALKDDLRKAIYDAVLDDYGVEYTDDGTDRILGAVWITLEDVVGSAQEALFNQLTAVRTELEASRRREAALREIVAQLSEKPEAEESSGE